MNVTLNLLLFAVSTRAAFTAIAVAATVPSVPTTITVVAVAVASVATTASPTVVASPVRTAVVVRHFERQRKKKQKTTLVKNGREKVRFLCLLETCENRVLECVCHVSGI